MSIWVENNQDCIEINEQIKNLLRTTINTCLKMQKFKHPYDVNILLVDNSQIKTINNEHRNIDKATDVLSFPLLNIKNGNLVLGDGDINLDEGTVLLGDIIISIEKVKEQSTEFGHSFERELAFLTTHGMLHLLGFDHENEEDKQIMFKHQEDILTKMNLTR